MKKLMILIIFFSSIASFSQGHFKLHEPTIPLPPPPTTCYYPDLDGDGYGDATVNCIEIPDGITPLVTNNLDCDDTNPNVNLGGQAYYYDLDGDGFGNPNNSIFLCVFDPTLSIVTDSSDCDDTDASIGEPDTWHLDADGDFYKARPALVISPTFPPFPGGPTGPAVLIKSCSSPGSNYINANDPRLQPVFDCDDNDPSINISPTWYADTDGDGLGDPNTSRLSCNQPNGYVANNQDSCPDFASPENNCPYTPVQPSNENYVLTKTYLKALENDSEVTDNKDVNEQITYYDGLGRPIQEIAIKNNPDGKDIVQHYEYDQFGRTEKTYLPLPTNQKTGSLVTNPVSQINTYYQNKYGDTNPYAQQRFDNSPLSRVLESAAPGNDWQLSATSDSDHTTKFEYSTNSDNEIFYFNIDAINNLAMHFYYDAGELVKNIVKNENWKPGDDKLNTNEVFTDKNGRVVVEISYRKVDTTVEKLITYHVYDNFGRLRYVIPPKATKLLEPILTSKRYNDVAPFVVPLEQFTYSPNGSVSGSGNITFELTNNRVKINVQGSFNRPRRGRNGTKITQSDNIATLPVASELPDIALGNIISGPSQEAVSISIKNGKLALKDNFDYRYLTSVAGTFYSPILFKNTASTTEATTILNNLAFQYQYDAYNRQIAQKTPDKDWEYVVYDQLDRQILVQDASLKKDNLWLFTKYDAYGRAVYTGKYSSTKTRDALQLELDTFINASSNKANVEKRINSTTDIAGTPISYSNSAFPKSGIIELLSVSYFDDYNFLDSDKPITPSTIEGQTVTSRTKGLLTSAWIKTIGANTWSKRYTYFDERGRGIKTYEKNHVGGYTNSDTKLDFIGKVLYSTTTHKKDVSSELLTIKDRYDYDKSSRIISQFQKINDQPEEVLSTITYDPLGNPEEKDLGGIASSNTSLQNISYKYNIRGWLKEINDVDNIGNDLFAYKLKYNEPLEDDDAVTDGIRLFNGNVSQTIWRSKHDNLKQSYVYNYDVLDQLTDASYLSGDVLGRVSSYKFEVHNIRYDQNGNITRLNRNGLNGAGNPANPDSKAFDILSYTYSSEQSNQLTSITDTGDKTAGFIDGNTSGDDYEYDDNGNLIKDLNKGINLIEYNHLDLVEKITFVNGKSIQFTYDASGRKLAKVFVGDSNTSTTEYLGGFQYQQGQLQFFPNAEGYAYKDDSNTFKYTYIYSDQLGNNRVSYSDANADGTISTNEILSNSNYYPMGSILEGEFNASVASNFNYKFQGKELQLDGNVRLYDFGSRMYEPTVGRWFNADPQNQFYSPYLAMGNGYIITVDPDGEWVHIAIGAVIGGAINLAVNWDNIDNFGEGLAAFGTGALAGGLTAACGGCGAGAIAAIGAGTGALTAATNNVIGQTGNGVGLGDVQWGAVGQSAFIGAIAGGASSVASTWATNTLSAPLINSLSITSPLLQGGINGTIGGAAGGFIGGATGGLLATGTIDGAIDGGIDGLSSGAIIGLGTGLGVSYVNSITNKINPITGKPTSSNTNGIERPTTETQKSIKAFVKDKNLASGQKKVLTEIVDDYYKQMKNGTFNKNSGVAGFESKGKLIITDGNHRLNAAIRYGTETGDYSYYRLLINNGNIQSVQNINQYLSKDRIFKFPVSN